MRDFKGILQAFIVVALVTIAGLLFSINRKLENPNQTTPAPAVVASPAPVPEVAATQPAAVEVPPVHEAPPAQRIEKPKPSKKPDPVVREASEKKSQKKGVISDVPDRPPPSDIPATTAALPAKDPNGIAYANDGTTPPITAALPSLA